MRTSGQTNAPKGQHPLAQGSALGEGRQTKTAPSKGNIIITRVLPVLPLQGAGIYSTFIPRALPWARGCYPFGAFSGQSVLLMSRTYGTCAARL